MIKKITSFKASALLLIPNCVPNLILQLMLRRYKAIRTLRKSRIATERSSKMIQIQAKQTLKSFQKRIFFWEKKTQTHSVTTPTLKSSFKMMAANKIKSQPSRSQQSKAHCKASHYQVPNGRVKKLPKFPRHKRRTSSFNFFLKRWS